jgi:UDP-glucose 4-epimerase
VSVLVTGGAGYIGSATVEMLLAKGETVVVLDNLSRGHREAVRESVPFYQGDLRDQSLVAKIVREHAVDSCVHFAAFAYVGESVTEPLRYFENNSAEGVAFLRALIQAGVKRMVFSSTCATYGEPRAVPMTEDHPQHPANPYGWTKFFMERILESCDRAYGLRFAALRYFNAAGATARCGEDHDPETHLIPNVLGAASGRLPHVEVYGNDYATSDGTAVRDYIHIADLGSAHILALDHLAAGHSSGFFNLGTGRGNSVLEVIEAARRVTGKPIPVEYRARRAGDPSHLVAGAGKAREVLGWKPAFESIDEIIGTAWQWQSNHPKGYRTA